MYHTVYSMVIDPTCIYKYHLHVHRVQNFHSLSTECLFCELRIRAGLFRASLHFLSAESRFLSTEFQFCSTEFALSERRTLCSLFGAGFLVQNLHFLSAEFLFLSAEF